MNRTLLRNSRRRAREKDATRQPVRPVAPAFALRDLPRWLLLVLLGAGSFGAAFALAAWGRGGGSAPSDAPAGMVWIPGGEFTMGCDDRNVPAAEHPAHQVRVDGFWMDETDVTNAQFRVFVEATGYKTTAEIPLTLEGVLRGLPPGAPPPRREDLVAGSLVFTPPDHPVPLDDVRGWWKWTTGADWRRPEGPGSNIDGKEDHPVVHVSWDDAAAYAKWAGKRLPTEEDWERAARGGLDGKKYVWGDEPFDEEHPQCNNFQGHFPDKNTAKDGYERTSPVKAFKPNGYGLYDMAGNVWQWCGDWFLPEAYAA